MKKDRVVRFLESEYFGKRVPLLAEGANIINVLWSGEKWRVADIFGKKTIARFNVDGLFLQLIATKILELENLKQGLTWTLGRVKDPTNTRETMARYKLDATWVGMRLL